MFPWDTPATAPPPPSLLLPVCAHVCMYDITAFRADIRANERRQVETKSGLYLGWGGTRGRGLRHGGGLWDTVALEECFQVSIACYRYCCNCHCFYVLFFWLQMVRAGDAYTSVFLFILKHISVVFLLFKKMSIIRVLRKRHTFDFFILCFGDVFSFGTPAGS